MCAIIITFHTSLTAVSALWVIIDIFFSKATVPNGNKLCRNVSLMDLIRIFFYLGADLKFKMDTRSNNAIWLAELQICWSKLLCGLIFNVMRIIMGWSFTKFFRLREITTMNQSLWNLYQLMALPILPTCMNLDFTHEFSCNILTVER